MSVPKYDLQLATGLAQRWLVPVRGQGVRGFLPPIWLLGCTGQPVTSPETAAASAASWQQGRRAAVRKL